MDMFQHDSAAIFRFELRGELSGAAVWDLEHAWITAQSITSRKEIVVDISGIEEADSSGIQLLFRMRESGVRLIVTQTPRSEAFVRSMGISLAKDGHRPGIWALQWMHLRRMLR